MRAPIAAVALAAVASSFPLALAQGKPDPKADPKPASDEDPNDLASLEALALKVELEGHAEGHRLRDDLAFEKIGDLPRPKDLRFPSVKSSLEQEAEFTKKYYEHYGAAFEAAGKRARELAQEVGAFKDPVKGDDGVLFAKMFLKKYPTPKRPKKGDAAKLERDLATNEVRALALRLLERWERVRENAKRLQGKALEKELEARQEKARAFLKRYDFGPRIAKTRLDGSANLHVDLSKDTYDLVKKNLGVLRAAPLTDAKGTPLRWRDKPLHGATKVLLFDLKNALEDLSEHEYYVVQYAERDGDEEKGLMRLTGARLLLGTYHVLDAPDRVIVYVPEPR